MSASVSGEVRTVIWQPRDYQKISQSFLLDRTWLHDHKGAALFADPGLGKTATIIAYLEFLRDVGLMRRAFIVAPLRVAHLVWPQELAKWRSSLTCSIIHGPELDRHAALWQPADIFVTNPENLFWLTQQKVDLGDVMIVDESTMLKTWGKPRKQKRPSRGQCARHLARSFRNAFILTGTPCSNSLADLYAQIHLIDDGAALGRNVTDFRREYCYRGGYEGRHWIFRDDKADQLQEAIRPMCLTLRQEDWLDLPPLINNRIDVELPARVKKQYGQIERQLFTELDSGQTLQTSNAFSTCRQIANGGCYVDSVAVGVHDEKVKACRELIAELNGKPLMIAYQFNHDLERLKSAFPWAEVIKGGQSVTRTEYTVERWNRGLIRLLLVQPQAMSHGLNMQEGGHDIALFGLPVIPDAYKQLIRRIYRSGVSAAVRVHHILARGTVDVKMYRVQLQKDATQDALLDAIKER